MNRYLYEAIDANWHALTGPVLFQFEVVAATPHDAHRKAMSMAKEKNGGTFCHVREVTEVKP